MVEWVVGWLVTSAVMSVVFCFMGNSSSCSRAAAVCLSLGCLSAVFLSGWLAVCLSVWSITLDAPAASLQGLTGLVHNNYSCLAWLPAWLPAWLTVNTKAKPRGASNRTAIVARTQVRVACLPVFPSAAAPTISLISLLRIDD